MYAVGWQKLCWPIASQGWHFMQTVTVLDSEGYIYLLIVHFCKCLLNYHEGLTNFLPFSDFGSVYSLTHKSTKAEDKGISTQKIYYYIGRAPLDNLYKNRAPECFNSLWHFLTRNVSNQCCIQKKLGILFSAGRFGGCFKPP